MLYGLEHLHVPRVAHRTVFYEGVGETALPRADAPVTTPSSILRPRTIVRGGASCLSSNLAPYRGARDFCVVRREVFVPPTRVYMFHLGHRPFRCATVIIACGLIHLGSFAYFVALRSRCISGAWWDPGSSLRGGRSEVRPGQKEKKKKLGVRKGSCYPK